ncbi:MAG: mannosyltransferase, partial [Archangium sp.]|nr:mannosyltransferase [Archangium sp.]
DVGLRNWAIPGLFAGMLKLSAALGVTDVQARRVAVAIPQFMLHGAMLWATWQLAARRIEAKAAGWAVAVVGTYPLVLFFAGRTMSESLSAALLVCAFERLDAATTAPSMRPAFVGGLLLGLAQIARPGTAAFIIPALLLLAVMRRFSVLAWCIAGGALAALGLGVLDRVTWGASLPTPRFGGWWHSLFEYVDYNLVSGKASQQFGAEPAWFYLVRLFVPAAPALLLWRKLPALRAWLPLGSSLAYVAAVSLTPHKEDRFLYPALVVLTVTAAPAAGVWIDEVFKRKRAALHAVVLTAGVVATLVLLVQPTGFTPQRPELFRLTVRASREGTGLIIMNEGLWGAGGDFYAGGSNAVFGAKDRTPHPEHLWCTCDYPGEGCFQLAAQTPAINRAIFMDPHDERRTSATLAEFQRIGFHEVARDGDGHYLAR